MSNRAWVTLATNDSYGLGALVLAHSLRRAGSTYPAVVLITPSVTDAMRDRLGAVFAEVIAVDVLDSRDPTHLALLQRPELGVTFTKIHCWSLTQYEKCVFLDADTLIIQNCDELFEREELSAAPDVGWPDCFNSGVFVFAPSADTYSRLIAFAQERGSFDGGDQGLLNAFFSDWAQGDINRHLPFLYNVTSAAFYSYIPALKHYGQNLKIIHFIGPAKPWLQRYNWQLNTVDAAEHLRDFLQLWWNIFTGLVHNQLDTTMEPPVEVGPDEELPPESPPKDVQEYYAPKLDPQSEFPWHHPDVQNKQTDANDSNSVKSKFYDPWENYHGSAPPHEAQASYSTSHDENYKESTWNQAPIPYQAQAQETANRETVWEQYQPQHYEHKQEEHHQQDKHDHYQSHHDHTQHHQDHCHHDHNHTQGPSYGEESHHHSARDSEWHHGHQSQEVSFPSYQQVHSYESHQNTHYPDSREHAHSNEHTKHTQHGYHEYSIHKQHHTPEQHNILEQPSHHQHHSGSEQFSQPSQNNSFQESNLAHIHDSHIHQEHYHDYNKKETPALAFNQTLNQSDGQKNKEYGYVPINYEPVQRKRLQHVYYLHMDHRPKSNCRRRDNRVYLSLTSQEMTNGHISEEEDDDFRPRHPYDGFYLRHKPTIDARGHKVCSHEIPPTPTPSPSPPPSPCAPSPPLRTSSPAASDEYISASDGEDQTGVAGNLARVVPGESGYQHEALDDLTRRQGWEAGNIDYMGADSFDNIWAKISQTLNQPKHPSPPRKEPTPPKEPSPPKEKSQETPAPAESVEVPKPIETLVKAPAPVAEPVAEKPAEIAEPLPEPFLAICPAKPESPSELPKSEPATESDLPKVVEEALVAESAPKDAVAPAAAEKTERSVPATPPATPKTTPEATTTPVSEVPPQLEPVSEPAASAAPKAAAAPVQPAEATPEKALDSSTLTATSTDSPPLVNTPSKEETPAVSPTKLEERRKVAPAGRLQLSAPAPPDPLPTPDSELEDAAALAQSIIASEIAVTAPSPPAVPTSPPLRQQPKSLSVEEPEVPTPPVSLAQIGVKPKAKLTTAAQIEKSVAEKEASVPSTPTTPSEPGTPTSDPKKKLVKKAPKKEGGVSGEATTPVPPPRKKEKKPKEK